MIESILNGLKGQIGNEILQKTDAKPEQLGSILSVIGDVTKGEVKKEMLSGGLSTVMNLFSDKQNNTAASALQSSISSGIVSGLIQKIGLSEKTAALISSIALPVLMQLITKKNNATPENDSSPIESLFGDKKAGLVGNLLGKFLK